MEKRTRRIGWAVLFLGMALSITVCNPWTTVRTRKCRDCLAVEQTTLGFLELSENTVIERGEFADWFEMQNPNHKHEWWKTGETRSGFVGGHSNFVHGKFSLVRPKDILLLATKSPAEYETYRTMILSEDRRANDKAVLFARDAAFELWLGEPSQKDEAK